MNHAIQPAISHAMSALESGYVARRSFFNLFGITCRIFSLVGEPLFFVRLKAFKLKEDITIFRDETGSQPLLSIRARHIIDFSAAYDVVDLTTSQRVGALRRKGLKSILRDEWELLDINDQVIGLLQEDSQLMALLRRFLSNLIPQNYHLTVHGHVAASFVGTWNPFIIKHTVALEPDPARHLDRRLALAASVLLMTIEGKQN